MTWKQFTYAVYSRLLTDFDQSVAVNAGVEYRKLALFRSGLGGSAGLSDAEITAIGAVFGIRP